METTASPSQTSASRTDDAPTLDDAVRRVRDLDGEKDRRAWLERCRAAFRLDELLPILKAESERHLNIDPAIALRYAETLIFAGIAAGLPAYHALGLMARGDCERVLGRYAASVATMDEAGALYRSLGDEIGWARTRHGWLRSSYQLGQGISAMAVADEAINVLIRQRVWLRAANLTYNTAFICGEIGRYDEALARFDRAQALYDILGEAGESDAAQMKYNKAYVLLQRGEFEAALRLYEEIRPVFLRHGLTISLLRQEHRIARIHAARGHYTHALHGYLAVLAAMEEAGLFLDAAWVGLDAISCYLDLNRDGEARDLAEETITRFERHGTLIEAAQVRAVCAVAHMRLGNTMRARTLLDEAAQVLTVSGLDVALGSVSLQRAALSLRDEDWEAAAAGAEAAAAVYADHALDIPQAHANLIRSRALLARGERENAEQFARAALAVAEERAVPWLVHEAQHVVGNARQQRGDDADAMRYYDRAIELIEQMQRTLATDLRRDFLADKMEVYDDAIAASLRLDKPARAFAYLERAKSRALVDYLGNNLDVQVRAREGTDPALIAALTQLREEHHYFYRQLHGDSLVRRDGATRALPDTDALRDAVQDREKRIARLLDRIALDRTEGLDIATSATPEANVVPPLPPDTVLIEYHLHASGGEIFVVAGGAVSVVPLAAHPAEIARLLRQWHLNLAATARAVADGAVPTRLAENARGILAALHRTLLAPVAERIAGYTRVIVVPYGITHTVPFNALHDGARYLIETHEITACPSSGLLRLRAERTRRAERSALVIGHTNAGLLPAVRDEVRAVAAAFPGEALLDDRATRDAVIAAAPRHRIVHLAAHGEARLDNPAFAHIALADGQLSTVDVFNLRLHGALVTLSACETGRGVVAGGDELVGLSRGFLYAGAATLVQSLWRVEDGVTARLMGEFYGRLAAGATKGVALREAQRALLGTGDDAPFHWAPFQLIGDAGPL